jgi:DNA repair exonuclease SbcCD ATPase subunit
MFTNWVSQVSNLVEVVQSTVDEIVKGENEDVVPAGSPTTSSSLEKEKVGVTSVTNLQSSPALPSSSPSSSSSPANSSSPNASTNKTTARVSTQSAIADAQGWSSIDLNGSDGWDTIKKVSNTPKTALAKKETTPVVDTISKSRTSNLSKTMHETSKSTSISSTTVESTPTALSVATDIVSTPAVSKSETVEVPESKPVQVSSTTPSTLITDTTLSPTSSSLSALSALQAEFAALQEQNLLLQARASAFEALVASREGQLASLSAQAARSMEEANTFREQVEAGKGRLASSQTQLEEERKKVKGLTREKEAINDQLSEMSQKVADALNVAENRQKELLEKDNKVSEILIEGEGLSRKVAAAEATIKTLRSTIRTVEADRDARKEELATAEAQLSLLKSRVEELETLVAATSRDKDNVSGMATASQQMLTALEDEAVKLRSENKALRTNISSVQRELEEGKVQLGRALGDAQAADNEREQLEAALQASQSSEASASRLASGLEDQLRDLRKQLSAAQTSMGQREDDLRSALDEMTTRWQKAASAAEDSGLAALAQAYGASVSSSTSLAAPQGIPGSAAGGRPAVEAIIQQLAAAQSELQTRRETWASQRTSLQTRLEAAEAAADKAESEAKRAESSSADAVAALNALRTEMLALRSAKGRVDADAAILADRLRENESRIISLSSSLDAATQRISELSASTSDLRSRLDEAAGARSASSHMLGLLRDQLAKAASDLDAKTREVAELQELLTRSSSSKIAASPVSSSRDGPTNVAPLSTPGVGWLENALGKPTAAQTPSLTSSMNSSTPIFASPMHGMNNASSGMAQTPILSPHPSFLQVSMAEADLEREKLTEAVVELSARVKKYEGIELVCSSLRTQLAEAISRHDVLLELLGEREEELEDLRADIEEIKLAFREQLETALKGVRNTEGER